MYLEAISVDAALASQKNKGRIRGNALRKFWHAFWRNNGILMAKSRLYLKLS